MFEHGRGKNPRAASSVRMSPVIFADPPSRLAAVVDAKE
jgi:hypothetical protein